MPVGVRKEPVHETFYALLSLRTVIRVHFGHILEKLDGHRQHRVDVDAFAISTACCDLDL